MGTADQPLYITDSYDPQTQQLTEQNAQAGTAQTSVDDLHYTYNQVGDVTSEADTPAGASSAGDVQCFQYDYLGRLVQPGHREALAVRARRQRPLKAERPLLGRLHLQHNRGPDPDHLHHPGRRGHDDSLHISLPQERRSPTLPQASR